MNFYGCNTQNLHRFVFLKLGVLLMITIYAFSAFAQGEQIDERVLVVGEKTERIVKGQEIHAYGIQLKRGQVLRVSLKEKGADALIYVRRIANPQAVDVSAYSNYNTGFGKEEITAIADEDGFYGLAVRAIQTDESIEARYEFITNLSDYVTEKDKQRLQAELILQAGADVAKINDKEKTLSAINELEKVIKTWQTLGDKYWEGFTKIVIAELASDINELDKAENYFFQALPLFDKTLNKAEIGNVYGGLFSVYLKKKDTANVLKYSKEALEIFRLIGDKRSEKAFSGINSQTIGTIVEKLSGSNTKKTSTEYEQELNEAKKKNNEKAQLSILTQYLFAVVLGEIFEDEFDIKKMSLQEASVRGKRIDEKTQQVYQIAETDGFRLARKLKDKNAEMQLYVLLGMDYAELNNDNSTNYLLKGLLLSNSLNDKIYELMAYFALSSMYDDVDDNLGIFFGKKSIHTINSYRKSFKNLSNREDQQLLAKEIEKGYETIAIMLTEESRLDEALQVLNFGRDQEFFDYKLIDNQSQNSLALSVNEQKAEFIFNNFLKEISNKNLHNSRTDILLTNDEINKIITELEEIFDDGNSANNIVFNVKDALEMKESLAELSKVTGKNHVSIYVVGDEENVDRGFLFVTPQKIMHFESTNQDIPRDFYELYQGNFDQVYFDFLGVLTSQKFDPRPLGSVIYKTIFKSIEYIGEERKSVTLESELEKNKVNVIHWSLTGKMRYIPIAALYDEERKQFLVEQYENVIFTRAKKDSFLIPPKRWEKGLGFGRSYSDDLPFVKEELHSIFGNASIKQKALFAGNVFLNENFDVDSLLAIPQNKPDFIHIATHFKFEPGEAGKSVLMLGNGKTISLIDFQYTDRLFEGVDLLALSACETAVMHTDANGKEIDGFAELAQRLGAKSVIATLWSIEDTSASRLMTEFYRLKQENPDASKSEALRLAQLTLLNGENSWDTGLKNRGVKPQNKNAIAANKYTTTPFTPDENAKFSHPYFWAAYVLYGGSNGGKLTKPYKIPQPPPRMVSNNVENTNFKRDTIAGTWIGKYVCSQGVTGVILTIEQFGGNVQGRFDFYPVPENPTFNKSGSGLYKGSFDPNFGVMQLYGERWISQPEIGWVLVGFSGSFDENRQNFSGKMLNPNCGAIELKREISLFAENSSASGFGNFSTPSTNINLTDIENSFKNNLYDETIRLGNAFLQKSPDSKEANAYIGLSYFLKKDTNNAVTYLEKSIRLGQMIPIPVKRLRIPLIGHAFEEAKITFFPEGILIEDTDSHFLAKYSDLTEVKLNTYFANLLPQCGIIFIKGNFIEVKSKSEKKKLVKKQFDLFPISAYLVSKQSGKLVFNEAACNNSEDFVPATIFSLISRLRMN